MIIDIPTPEEFEATGVYLLNLAWDGVSALYLDLQNSRINKWGNGEITDQFWQAAQRPLANALVLTQQGIEFLLKAKISEISPFLLIDSSPKNWPRGCNDHDTSYADFRMIDAQDLIRVHDTVRNSRLDAKFRENIESLRRKRNAIMHSVDRRLRYSPSDLWKTILEVSHHLIGSQKWIALRHKYLVDTPNSIAYNTEGVIYKLSLECMQLLEILQPAEARKLLGVDLKSRWYICYTCLLACSNYGIRPATAQLRSNDPTSTTVYCFVCGQEEQVVRKDCIKADCKGNVIHLEDNFCLTCDTDQD